MGTQALLDGDDAADYPPPGNDDFIAHLSKINIVNCSRFAEQWVRHEKGTAYEDSVGLYSVSGNSRESPTPMSFPCQATPQCPYVSIHKKCTVAHEALCSPEYVAQKRRHDEEGENFHCDQCEKPFLTQHLLNIHIKSVHNFTPIPCPEGCDPAHIYPSRKTLDAHIRREHRGIWPARCLYPGCDNETKFKSSSYSNHLTKVHKLTTRAARAPHFPPNSKRTWQPTACDIDDCTSSHAFARQSSLVGHLVKAHGYEKDAADRASERGWTTKEAVQVQETSIMRADEDEAEAVPSTKRRRLRMIRIGASDFSLS